MATRVSEPAKTELDQLCINAIRMLAVDAVELASSGHAGAPMGLAPAAYALWDRVLQHDPADPAWPDRDRFVLSAGHASLLLYSLLHLTGYDLPLDELKRFRQWGSKTPGHPEYGVTPGVEVTTGPLGQGVGNAVGMAVAERILANRYNRPGHEIVNHFVYCICSDGDLQEGVASEAASLAGTLGLNRLILLYDSNGITIDGRTDISFRENVANRFHAYNWHVDGPIDGNDPDAVETAIKAARVETGQPSLIILNTTIGFGSPNHAGTSSIHSDPLGDEEVRRTRKALGWNFDPFVIPDEVNDHMRGAIERGRQAHTHWNTRLAAYRADYPDEAAALEKDLAGELPDGWEAALDGAHATADSAMATRVASGIALNAAADVVQSLTGGSADLAGSNNSTMKGRSLFQSEDQAGSNIAFGVREHGMGAIANGISVHGGLTPYTATFMIFADYMRPAIRLAALSGYPVIYTFTHDSIGLGEDGPTHQPVAHLMSLRAMPGLVVIRPADPHETIEAWRVALARRDGPTVLVFTRQSTPPLDASDARQLAQGAYAVLDCEGEPEIILIATGSEVAPTLEAGRKLAEAGRKVRVISMPSWELFDSQPPEYREELLPSAVRTRIAVEAGSGIGWERYVGLDGDVIAMDSFGASAPGGVNMEKFGFTADNILGRSKTLLEQSGQ